MPVKSGTVRKRLPMRFHLLLTVDAVEISKAASKFAQTAFPIYQNGEAVCFTVFCLYLYLTFAKANDAPVFAGEIRRAVSVSWRHLPQITNRFVKKSYYRKRLSKQRVKKPVFKSNDVWAAAGNRLKCAEGRPFRYSAASVPYPACSPGRSGTLAALRYRAEALNCRKSDIFSKTY